ncbi:LD-carboxypeptidase [Candidatus Woesearchaeota archaeon]|jgi:muramoyltetrapeptide carboxypeptidase|nr:LD-carboxypeptidase [Candidatus Woesearchaeota archaeon]
MKSNSRIIAPSKKISKHELIKGIQRLHKIGFIPKYNSDITSSDIYFAGTLQRRVLEIETALLEVKNPFIFCARGGYASMELLSHINPKLIKKSKKTIIGHSDITALLLGFYKKGFQGNLIHGPNICTKNWIENSVSEKLLIDCLTNKPYKINLKNHTHILNEKSFNGHIIGGNLRIICHMIGTEYEIDTNKKILFLEDVNERPAAIYNMLLHLKLAGKLKNIKALLIGNFQKSRNYLKLLEKFIKTLKIPIIYELRLGHQNNIIPIRLGDYVHYNTLTKNLSFKNNKQTKK